MSPGGDLMDDVEDLDGVDVVDLRHLPPSTALLVCTQNSVYRIVVMDASNGSVQGGTAFPGPTAALVNGFRVGGSSLNVGWIRVGFLMEIYNGNARIVTSPVRAILTGRADGAVVN